MLFTIFILIAVFETFLALKFSKLGQLSVNRSNEINIGIFGRKYSSIYELYMDFNFLNELFDGKRIFLIEDDKLCEILNVMRKVLIGQIFGGLLFLFLGVALGLSN